MFRRRPPDPCVAAPSRPGAALSGSLLAALIAVASSCTEIDRESRVAPATRRIELARGTVTPAEGGVVVADANGSHPAVRLEVPAGAVATTTDVSIAVRFGDPELPSFVQSFEVLPQDLDLAVPARLRVDYATSYELATRELGAEDRIDVFSKRDGGALRVHDAVARDATANAITCATLRFGTFFALHPELHSLFLQSTAIVDPRRPLARTRRGSIALQVTSADDDAAFVGRGSLTEFWRSSAPANLLVVHGLGGTAFELLGSRASATTRALGIPGRFRNVVVFQFPSGRSLRDQGNALYDLVAANRRPGFGCRVLAFSTGGLVARWALERAHADPTRPGFAPDQEPLATAVDDAVLVGTPNRGVDGLPPAFVELVTQGFERDGPFLAGIVDALPGSELLNRLAAPSAMRGRYRAIAGSIVELPGSDGIVRVASATAVPPSPGREDAAFFVFSGRFYRHQELAALAAHTGVIEQAMTWLATPEGNRRAIVGDVSAPERERLGEYLVRFAIADRDSDPCDVTVEFRVNGGAWTPATASPRTPAILGLPSSPAPGRHHRFVWDARADGVGGRALASLRFAADDGSGLGVSGQTPLFVVE